MSKVLCCMPGRAGDILWACAVIRDLSAFYETPVDLVIAGEFASLIPLLEQQPYLASVAADPEWGLTPEQVDWPKTDAEGGRWERVHNLGYQRWPELPLPFEVWHRVASGFLPRPDLGRPWITARSFEDATLHPYPVTAGWTECYFELKYGLSLLLTPVPCAHPYTVLCPFGSRWSTDTRAIRGGFTVYETDWFAAARFIASSKVFLGDCSALHVLAVALGIPVVCYEPMVARHNPIFWPCGMDGPQVRIVRGGDGKPTTDVRHTADYLKEALRHAR